MSCAGTKPSCILWEYSKYLTTKKIRAQTIVVPKYILYFPRFFCLRATQAITMVTLERINITVLNVACGMVSFKRWIIEPCSPIGGHTGAPVRSSMYAEKSPPKSMISEAKKSHIPSFELYNPVSSLSSTLYGISINIP